LGDGGHPVFENVCHKTLWDGGYCKWMGYSCGQLHLATSKRRVVKNFGLSSDMHDPRLRCIKPAFYITVE